MSNNVNENSPEVELLLICARPTCLPEGIEDHIVPEIDWDKLFNLSNEHYMLPILYRRLQSVSHYVPEDKMIHFRDAFNNNAFHNLQLTSELFKILELFDEHNILAIPLKGPQLAIQIYGDLALREFSDLDILVPASQVIDAKRMLQNLGYRLSFEMNRAQEHDFLKASHHFNLTSPDSGVTVELHWRLSPRIRLSILDSDSLFDRAKKIDFLGKDVLTISAEDMVLYLCEHGTGHCWDNLGLINDIARLIHVGKINWDEVLQRAIEGDRLRSVSCGIILANRLLGASVPEKVMEEMQSDPIAGFLVKQGCRKLFDETREYPMNRILFQLKVRQRNHERIIYLLELVMNPTQKDWRAQSLPEFLNIAYHLVRPVRIFKDCAMNPNKYFPRLRKRF